MMGSMRTKSNLDSAVDQQARQEKENDIAKIANARDIFRHMEAGQGEEQQQVSRERICPV